MVQEDEAFVGKVVRSDEAQFKLNGTVNRYNCVYWCENNPHAFVEKLLIYLELMFGVGCHLGVELDHSILMEQ